MPPIRLKIKSLDKFRTAVVYRNCLVVRPLRQVNSSIVVCLRGTVLLWSHFYSCVVLSTSVRDKCIYNVYWRQWHMNEKICFQIGFCHERSFSLESEFKTSDCKKITIGPYWRPAANFVQPLVSNCLFIYANFWREIQTSDCKILSLVSDMDCGDVFAATSLELKLNTGTLPLTEANSQHTDVDVLLAFSR